MSQYYMLLKNHLIDFEKLIIDLYPQLGLDEIDTFILIKLNRILENEKKFSVEHIAKKMTVSESIISDRLVSLINNQFITLTLSGKKEIYTLDDTYKRLAVLLESNDNKIVNKNNENDYQKIVNLIEKEFQKILAPLDLEIIHNWIYTDKFSIDDINKAILETLKYKKYNVKYIDMILNKTPDANKNNIPKEGIQELFNNVYKKIK